MGVFRRNSIILYIETSYCNMYKGEVKDATQSPRVHATLQQKPREVPATMNLSFVLVTLLKCMIKPIHDKFMDACNHYLNETKKGESLVSFFVTCVFSIVQKQQSRTRGPWVGPEKGNPRPSQVDASRLQSRFRARTTRSRSPKRNKPKRSKATPKP